VTRLEIGKTYVRADGAITGPMEANPYENGSLCQFRDPLRDLTYRADGVWFDGSRPTNNLVSEVRSVTPTHDEAATAIPGGGTKHDGGKPDLSLIPLAFLEPLARTLMEGERRYGRYQYLRGFRNVRLLAAALRHIYQYLRGEECASDSGLPHLAHAAANIAILFHCAEEGVLEDARASARHTTKGDAA
jgi:hypothetical protein